MLLEDLASSEADSVANQLFDLPHYAVMRTTTVKPELFCIFVGHRSNVIAINEANHS